MDETYSNLISDYSSEEQFANFREIKGGTIKPGYLYRGASAIKNTHNRVKAVNRLLEKNQIRYILDIAARTEKLPIYYEETGDSSKYFRTLYEAGNVKLLGIKGPYDEVDYSKKFGQGLLDMVKHEGPHYINCVEGKDRTGFACVVIESLCRFTKDEMFSDYMETYKNYYGTRLNDFGKAKFDEMTALLKTFDVDLEKAAKIYLKKGGLTDSEIEFVADNLNK